MGYSMECLRFLARNGLRLGGFVRETESCEEMHSL